MNCKHDELAVITRVPTSAIPSTRFGLQKLIGKVVRVTSLYPGAPVPTWRIHEPFFNPMAHGVYLIDRVEDWCLTPLRGCSVNDESHARAGDPLILQARSAR
jgi:hypothetical protein